MRLAFSSLAWKPSDDVRVAAILRTAGFGGIELAPTKLWPDLANVSADEALLTRGFWRDEGLPIVATQAILFGRSDLQLFGSAYQRRRLEHFLGKAIELTALLGGRVVVFGAPGNRKKGSLTTNEANEIAVPAFSRIGDRAADCGVSFCIEPNPIEYGCDWIVNAAEGREIVAQVGSSGFKLHLDSGALSMSSASALEEIESSSEVLCHFHVSEPNLRPVGLNGINHVQIASAMNRARYAGWCSVEMREPEGLEVIATTAAFCGSVYGEQESHNR